MNAGEKIEELWYGSQRGLVPALLGAASLLYGAGHGVRRSLYRLGMKKTVFPGLPCVSVGNIVVGGTGKTPVSAWLVETLLGMGRKPAVVSRGYGGVTVRPARVPPAGGIDASRRFGDEPVMLAARFPEIPVVVARDRAAAAAAVVSEFDADVLVADDAFQHWRLGRNLDIVLVDAGRWFGNGRLLPGGPLREPPEALARADAILLTRPEKGTEAAQLEQLRRLAPDAAVASAEIAPTRWRSWKDGQETDRPGGPVFAFCGIANAASFRRSLEDLRLDLAGWRSFADHHPYSGPEIRELQGEAERCGAVAAVTTAKDAVRLAGWEARTPLRVLEVELRIKEGRDEVTGMIGMLTGEGQT